MNKIEYEGMGTCARIKIQGFQSPEGIKFPDLSLTFPDYD